jgi:hypothetical protein
MATERKTSDHTESPESVTVRGEAAVVTGIGESVVTDAFMRNLGTISGNAFDDAMALAEQLTGESVKSFADEMGNGFAILDKDQKARLIGLKCVFLKWKFTDGDFGRFVNVAVITQDGAKYILNDGSTGICEQLWDYTQTTGKDAFRLAPRGLRDSNYATCGNCGKPRDSREDECTTCHDTDTKRGTGTTYYIDLAAEA